MVAKCVNPYCNRPFRYLGQGKLFVTEYPPTLASGINLRGRTREHFWLCDECARIMTIAVRREHGGVLVRILNLPPNGKRKLDFNPAKPPIEPVRLKPRPLPEIFFKSL
jgi:hypothetical protein